MGRTCKDRYREIRDRHRDRDRNTHELASTNAHAHKRIHTSQTSCPAAVCRESAAVQLQAWWKGHEARITLLSLFKKHLGVREVKEEVAPAPELSGVRPAMKS